MVKWAVKEAIQVSVDQAVQLRLLDHEHMMKTFNSFDEIFQDSVNLVENMVPDYAAKQRTEKRKVRNEIDSYSELERATIVTLPDCTQNSKVNGEQFPNWRAASDKKFQDRKRTK